MKNECTCSNCGSSNIARYVYGFPDEEKFKKKDSNIICAGTIIRLNQPRYHCQDCGMDFYEDMTEWKEDSSDNMNPKVELKRMYLIKAEFSEGYHRFIGTKKYELFLYDTWEEAKKEGERLLIQIVSGWDGSYEVFYKRYDDVTVLGVEIPKNVRIDLVTLAGFSFKEVIKHW